MKSLISLFFATVAAVGAPLSGLTLWNAFVAARPLAFPIPEAVSLGAVLLTPVAAILGVVASRGVPEWRGRAVLSAASGAAWALPLIARVAALIWGAG